MRTPFGKSRITRSACQAVRRPGVSVSCRPRPARNNNQDALHSIGFRWWCPVRAISRIARSATFLIPGLRRKDFGNADRCLDLRTNGDTAGVLRPADYPGFTRASQRDIKSIAYISTLVNTHLSQNILTKNRRKWRLTAYHLEFIFSKSHFVAGSKLSVTTAVPMTARSLSFWPSSPAIPIRFCFKKPSCLSPLGESPTARIFP